MKFYPNYYDQDQLYNVHEDPLERENLYQDPQQKMRVQAMRRLLREAVGNVPGTFAEFTEPIQSSR